MQIKRYSMKDKDIYDKFLYHINKNEPCIISNFIDNNNNDIKYIKNNNLKGTIFFKENAPKCSIKNLLNFFNLHNIKCGFNCYEKSNRKIVCSNNLLDKLVKNKRFIFYKDGMRIWNNNKDQFTGDHFDFFGQHNLNICLKGQKKFYLAKPNTFKTFPNNNTSIFVDVSKYNYKVIQKSGELLYIPSFWHHRVYTLQKSYNFNVFFWDYNQKLTKKNESYLMLHKIFNTQIYKDSGYITILKNKNPYSLNTLKFFLLDNFLLIIIFNFLLNKINLNFKIILLILIILFNNLQSKKIYKLYSQYQLNIVIVTLIILLNIIYNIFY